MWIWGNSYDSIVKFVRNTSLVEIQLRYEWVELLYANLPHLYANFQNLSALLWGIRDFPSNFFSAFFFHSHGSLCFYWISNYCWFLPCIKKKISIMMIIMLFCYSKYFHYFHQDRLRQCLGICSKLIIESMVSSFK